MVVVARRGRGRGNKKMGEKGKIALKNIKNYLISEEKINENKNKTLLVILGVEARGTCEAGHEHLRQNSQDQPRQL